MFKTVDKNLLAWLAMFTLGSLYVEPSALRLEP
jgi:hypothetical protein